MIPRTLSILFTYKCNFFCKHCSVRASPRESSVFNFSLFKKLVDEAVGIPSINTIVFTGGEPTLFLNELVQAIRYAHDSGFNTRIVTNAWWANSIEQAKRIVNILKKAGLNELNISFDEFHKPWLLRYGGDQNIVNAVRAALEEGLNIVIGIVKSGDNDMIDKTYIINLLERNNIDVKNIVILEDYVHRLGRGKSIKLHLNLEHERQRLTKLKTTLQ